MKIPERLQSMYDIISMGGWLPLGRTQEGDKILKKYKPKGCIRSGLDFGEADFSLATDGIEKLVADMINSYAIQIFYIRPNHDDEALLEFLMDVQKRQKEKCGDHLKVYVRNDNNYWFEKIPSHRHKMEQDMWLEYFREMTKPKPQQREMPKGFI